MTRSSDIDVTAVLLPHYRLHVARGAFERLSQQHQIDHLRDAVEVDQPILALAMKAWTPTQQSAVLAELARGLVQRPPAPRSIVWTVRRADRTLTAVAVTLDGDAVDLRLLDGGDFVRTQLCADERDARTIADAWQRQLQAVGWR